MKNIVKISLIISVISSFSIYSADKTLQTIQVAKQSGADCGYHALKNAQMVYHWAMGAIDTKTLNKNINSQNPAIFPLETWRNAIIKRRKSVGIPVTRGANLIEHEIEFLAKAFLDLDSTNYTIIPNVTEKNIDTLLMLDAGLVEAIRKIRSNVSAMHAFILGNMSTNSSATGHWVAIVVRKDTKANLLNFYAMDSLGGTPRNMFNSLKNIIENANIDVAQINIEFEPEIDRIEKIMNKTGSKTDQKLQESLEALNRVIDLATKKDLITKPCFHASNMRISQILDKIMQLDHTKEYKFAFEATKLRSKLMI